MANELSREQLQRLARLGARARLEELEAERKAIMRAFPALGRPSAGGNGEAASEQGEGKRKAAGNGRRRGRRKMTAAQKKAQSERMKKLWAERRKAQG